jgi:hypothetical protein
MTASLPEVPFTDLLRSPAATTDRLRRDRAMRLRRRDDEDLVLMRADRATDEAEVVDFTARLLSELLRDGDDGTAAIRRVLPRVLPWTRFLPEGSADLITAELVEVAQASQALNTVIPVAQVLVEWRHTAEVYADPQLLEELTRERGGDAGPVPCPMADEADPRMTEGEDSAR